jgi:3-oxoacyl-[acyl-carrier-protein] synthase III
MANLSTRGASIKGIASAVPVTTEGIEELAKAFGDEEARKIVKSTGVTTRHVVKPGQCTSDLCFAATQKLLADLNWAKESVDALVFVSQTFDYTRPATSCCLQGRLGLPKSCAAFDIALGCSGYVYGLLAASNLVSSGCGRVLLLVGETCSTANVSPFDRATVPLFGDAGTATALEADSSGKMHFQLGSDGMGYNFLIVPAGGSRMPRTPETAIRTKREDGTIRSDEDGYMNGPEIFGFTLREVPPLISGILNFSGWNSEQVDAFVMHQANRFMLDHLCKRMKLPPEKVPLSLEDYGNTSSASIPLTITHRLRQDLRTNKRKLVLAGFGIGLSWGAVALELGPIVAPDVEIVP